MKHLFTILSVLLLSSVAFSQSERQVKWTYSAKKIADKTYEVHMVAAIGSSYHMYSQNAGVEGPLPTTITFTKNPLVEFSGKPKENGKLIKKVEEVWGGEVKYYEKSVEFVQVIKLKGNVKTNVVGKVEFIVCNDQQCLPPSSVDFNVNIGG